MPKVTVVDVVETEREVEVPTICPGCKADLTERFALKMYSSCVIMQQARFMRDGTIGGHVGGDEGDIGPVVELRCAECDHGLTE
jgi:hypothetical protein